MGSKGTEGNISVIGVGGYNGGGNGGSSNGYARGSGGSGATHICLQDGVLKDLKNAYENNQLLMVAGGEGGKVGPYGIAGYGGGLEGGKPKCLYNGGVEYNAVATQSSGYAFGTGQTGRTGTNNSGGYEGGGGGGGLYGGFAPQELGSYTNHTGGGGSGYVNAKLVDGTTIAGNQSFLSPSGVSETGHAGNGAALISWLP